MKARTQIPISLIRGSLRGVYPVFHVSILRQWHEPSRLQTGSVEVDPVLVDGAEEWFVERILDLKLVHNRPVWLVQWRGCPPEEWTWEPEKNLAGNEAFEDWVRANGKLEPRPRKRGMSEGPESTLRILRRRER